MNVNLGEKNPAVISLFENPNQIITMDANLLIPPHREIKRLSFPFSIFQSAWLNPIFETFSKLAIHEAVLREFVSKPTRSFIEQMLQETPPRIIIHRDSELTEVEQMLRNSFEAKIYPYTHYDPSIDNRTDRGEVKTLAFIAVKGLLYFAAHDYNALQLIENAESWKTGLDGVKAIKMFELIYFIREKYPSLKTPLRTLYKYQYHLTNREKEKKSCVG